MLAFFVVCFIFLCWELLLWAVLRERRAPLNADDRAQIRFYEDLNRSYAGRHRIEEF